MTVYGFNFIEAALSEDGLSGIAATSYSVIPVKTGIQSFKVSVSFQILLQPADFLDSRLSGLTAYGFNFVEAALSDDPHELFTLLQSMHPYLAAVGWRFRPRSSEKQNIRYLPIPNTHKPLPAEPIRFPE